MHRRILTAALPLLAVVLSGCAAPAGTPHSTGSAGRPPNILLITVDDLNDWTGALGGHPNASTPNIDALARDGVLFTNAHTQAPLCGPSRASLLTGLYPTTSGIYLHIDDRAVHDVNAATRATLSLPEYFGSRGYRTMGFGKIWHGNDLGHTFQTYGEPYDWFGPQPAERINYDPVKGPNYDGLAGTGTDWGAYPSRDEEMSDYRYASDAIERLQQEHDRPFFLAVGFVRPHVPWYVPRTWLERHPLEGIHTPPYRADDLDDVPEVARRMAFMPPMPTTEYLKEKNQWAEMVRAYLASTTWTDHQVGRVLQALRESRYADNTIVVLLSDHGYTLGEKGRVAKMSLWERDTHVPLIVSGPGVPRGVRSSRAVGLIDVYPTLLELAGLPANSHNEGRSLVPLLGDPDRAWPYPAMTIFGPRNVSLRTDSVRYTRYEDGSEEYYDHRSDPNEWENLAHPAVRSPALAAEIDRLRGFIPTAPAPLAEASSFDMNPYFRERMPVWREAP